MHLSPALLSNSDSIFQVETGLKDEGKFSFAGTGFVISRRGGAAYVLTCAHVVDRVPGRIVRVAGLGADIVACGQSDDVDMAVLAIPDSELGAVHALTLKAGANPTERYSYIGWSRLDDFPMQVPGVGIILKRQMQLGAPYRRGSIWGWQVEVVGTDNIQSGHSGSPVMHPYLGHAIGVLSHRRKADGSGIVFAAEVLRHVWPEARDLIEGGISQSFSGIRPGRRVWQPRQYQAISAQQDRLLSAQIRIGTTTRELEMYCQQASDMIVRRGFSPLPDGGSGLAERLGLIDQADAYVCIVGHNSSPLVDAQGTLLEYEYQHARELKLPIMLFVMSDEHPMKPADFDRSQSPEQVALHDRFKQELLTEHAGNVHFFSNAEEFSEQLSKRLEDLKHYYMADETAQGQPAPTQTVLPEPPALYSYPAYILTSIFRGRHSELQTLDTWARSTDPVMVIEALGGTGKSALAWEWIQQRARAALKPAGIVWWNFDKQESSLQNFVRHVIAYINRLDPADDSLKQLSYDQLEERLCADLERAPYLLVLDGLERALVAYRGIDHPLLTEKQVREDRHHRDCTLPRDAEFLLRLTSLTRSRTLICTRLMPAPLEEAAQAIRGVRHLALRGLSSADARDLFLTPGIQVLDEQRLERFLREIGHHPMMIKLLAPEVMSYRPAPGNFDAWYIDRGVQLRLSELEPKDQPKPILRQALESLTEKEYFLLAQIAAFSGPVRYQVLADLMLPQAPPIELPPLPLTRTHPFGSPRLSQLRFAVRRTRDLDAQARIRAEIDQIQAADAEQAAQMELAREQLELDFQRVVEERRRLLDRHERAFRTSSPNYMAELRALEAALDGLENRGLIEWNRPSNSYDLHPLVRSYTLELVPSDDRGKFFSRIVAHFSARAPVKRPQVKDVDELYDVIQTYYAYIRSGEFDAAAALYYDELANMLWNLGAYTLTVQLLEPLFAGGFDQPPLTRDTSKHAYLTNQLGRALSQLGHKDKALVLYGQLLDPTALKDFSAFSDYLVNYARTLVDLLHIAEAAPFIELSAQFESEGNKPWALWSQLDFFVTSGQFDKADAALAQYRELPPAVSAPEDCAARMEYLEAQLRFYRGDAPQELLDRLLSADAAEVKAQNIIIAALRLAAEVALANGKLDQALDYLERHGALVRQTGQQRLSELSLLARVEQARGNTQVARSLLAQAMARSNNPMEQVRVLIDVAEFWRREGDVATAYEHAHQAYTMAWADGPPYVAWWSLHLAGQLLDQLGQQRPVLPAFDPRRVPSMPFAAELQKALEKHNQVKKPGENLPRPTAATILHTIDWVQIGMLAPFGLVDETLIKRLATKVTALSTIPEALSISRRGGETPDPPDPEPIARRTISELRLSIDERRSLAKWLIFAYIEGRDQEGRMHFGYYSFLLHRFFQMLHTAEQRLPIRMRDYNASLILSGEGRASEEHQREMDERFIFGVHTTQVRIFPPEDDQPKAEAPPPPLAAQQRDLSLTFAQVNRLHIGLLSPFGLDERAHIEQLAQKIAALGTEPQALMISSKGDDEMQPLSAAPEHRRLADLVFGAEESRNLKNWLSMIYLEGVDNLGSPIFAFGSTLLHQLIKMMPLIESGGMVETGDFNFSPMIFGPGKPSEEQIAKMKEQYLFGIDTTNVRIFP